MISVLGLIKQALFVPFLFSHFFALIICDTINPIIGFRVSFKEFIIDLRALFLVENQGVDFSSEMGIE